jgi:hypothetical protein
MDLFDDEPLYAAATEARRRQIMLVKELYVVRRFMFPSLVGIGGRSRSYRFDFLYARLPYAPIRYISLE